MGRGCHEIPLFALFFALGAVPDPNVDFGFCAGLMAVGFNPLVRVQCVGESNSAGPGSQIKPLLEVWILPVHSESGFVKVMFINFDSDDGAP